MQDLHALGAETAPNRDLDTFPNPAPESDYTIRIRIPEFTCLCPKTGQPDFAEILLEYVPDQRCIELKSLKLYMWSFRNEGAFHEAITNRMLADLRDRLEPRFIRVSADFNVRGGLYTSVVAEYRQQAWIPASPVQLP
ncbi:MAG: preQ(1) synthase [Gammaproteobacteria bacterium]